MGILKNIWYLLTGMNKNLEKAFEKDFKKLDKILEVLNTQGATLLKIVSQLEKIQADLQPPPAVALEIKLGGVVLGESNMLQVADNGSVLANLEADDALGNPGAKLESVPAWSLSDSSLGSVNASEDGMTAVVVLSGKLGTFKLHVEAQSAGATLAADSDDIEVVAGAAALLKVSLSSQ